MPGSRANHRLGLGSPRAAGIALGLTLLATACTAAVDSDLFTPQIVEITLSDYAFHYDGPLRPGRVVFRVRNEGDVDHEVALVELPDDVADVHELVDSDRIGVAPVYTMASRAPGETGVFAVDLAQGRYGLLGFGQDSQGTPYYRKGMVADLDVGNPP